MYSITTSGDNVLLDGGAYQKGSITYQFTSPDIIMFMNNRNNGLIFGPVLWNSIEDPGNLGHPFANKAALISWLDANIFADAGGSGSGGNDPIKFTWGSGGATATVPGSNPLAGKTVMIMYVNDDPYVLGFENDDTTVSWTNDNTFPVPCVITLQFANS